MQKLNTCKKTGLTIGSIITKMDKFRLNCDHPLQRESEQYSRLLQGNLISDILQGNPIPELVFAEQILHEAPITWVLDGKQRCTTVRNFSHNMFGISRNVERFEIEYPVPLKDSEGSLLRDKDGIIMHETKVFDIRGKKFSDLPVELQERFMEYQFDIVFYYDCSEANLAYHIKRYNAGKAMNTEQKGITRIGTHNASVIRNISNMSFFSDSIGNYTHKQFENSKILRIVAESIMTSRCPDGWKKSFDANCDYIRANITSDDYESFREYVSELEDGLDTSVGKMFNDTDSFLWFGLYGKFKRLGLSCAQFNEFMLKLNRGLERNNAGKIIKDAPMTGLCVRELDGTTFEEVFKSSSTKDVNIVKARIEFLTKLACSYLGIEMPIESVDTFNKVEPRLDDGTDDTESSQNDEVAPSVAITSDIDSTKSNDEDLTVDDIPFTDDSSYNFADDDSDDFEIKNCEELEDFAQNFIDDRTAIECLMSSCDGHGCCDFERETLNKFVRWYEKSGDKSLIDDCLKYKKYVNEGHIKDDNPNLALFVWAVKYIFDNEIEDDIYIQSWIEEFATTAFYGVDNEAGEEFRNDSNTISRKKAEVEEELEDYIY